MIEQPGRGRRLSRLGRPRLYGWHHPAILSAAAVSVASGFAQFSVTASLGQVAAAFGEVTDGGTVAAQVGLTTTTLGIGLALIRLASLASLPLAGLGDRFGRRTTLLWCAGTGLTLTGFAALSPGYWWFVVIVALGRPLLSAVNAIAGVIAAEETTMNDRAKAVALVAAAYATGAGVTALIRGVAADVLGFRGLFALIVVPLVLLPLLARLVEEPERFRQIRAAEETGVVRRPTPLLGPLRSQWRGRLVLMSLLSLSFAVLTGPFNTYLFVYAENVLSISPARMAVVVGAAGPIGLGGLLLGRWVADRVGRRPVAGTAHVLVALAGMLTYSGARSAVMVGYLAGVFAGGVYGPAAGVLAAELFPTSIRSTAAGWLTGAGVVGAVTGLLLFGVLTDVSGGFPAAARMLALPALLVAVLFVFLPETRGRELEESAPEEEVPEL